MKNVIIIAGITLVLCSFIAQGASFTLSDSALMRLDYNYQASVESPDRVGGFVSNVTDIAGPGVKFDIWFPDPLGIQKFPDLLWASCVYGGSNALAGIDIHSYDAFALKFTLLSANGVSLPNAAGPIYVGAAINTAEYEYLSVHHPELIEINDQYTPSSITAVTATDASQINFVGFACYIPWQWYAEGWVSPNPWDPAGATISLLVEPAPGAAVITPEPATLLLLGLGAVMLRRKR